MTPKEITEKLRELSDEEYRLFQLKLMPGVTEDRVLGVRTPLLRKFAKELAKDPDIENFLTDIPHRYYDENNLHGFIISECKDYEKSVAYVDAILPYVDNWATCDLLSPKAFKKNRDKLIKDIDRWLASNETYTVRFGIEMLMSHFLDEDFRPEYLEKLTSIHSEEYYVNMMLAWFFATALAKQWDDTISYIEEKRLSVWVHNKTIQKAVESYRITDEQKAYLKGMKIK